MRDLTVKIAASGREEYPIQGDFIRLGDTNPSVTFEDAEHGYRVTLAAGDAIRLPKPFLRLAVEHGEASEQTIEFTYGFGDLKTARFSGTVSVTPPASGAALPDVVVGAGGTADVAANQNRMELHVYNPGANVIRWGSPTSPPGAAAGGAIPPGIVGVIPVSGAVRFYNGGAGAITLNVSEVVK